MIQILILGNAQLLSYSDPFFLFFYILFSLLPSHMLEMGLLWWLSGTEPTCNAGDMGSIPGSGRLPGEGSDNPLQYSCLGNPIHRGAW